MSHNINEIKANFGAGARPTQFSVQITNPINTLADRKVPFVVKATSLPGLNLGVIELGYFGRKVKIPGDRTYDEWNTTVMNDEDFSVRNYLEAWSAAINSPVGNIATRGSDPTLYQSQATVTQYSIDGRELRIIQLNNIWPSNIAPITLDWDATNQVEEYAVTWQYDTWEVVGGETGEGPGR